MVSSLPTTVLLPFLDLPMRATYLFRLILILLLDFINLNTRDELQITTNSSLCTFLRPLALLPSWAQIPCSTACSPTRFHFGVRYQVSHPIQND